MMRLIGMLDSPYVRRVAIAMETMGLPFSHEELSVFRNYPAFEAINPVVKAPTFVTGEGTVLMESSLILEHLERIAPPERRLMPAGIEAHARCLRLTGLALIASEKAVQLLYEHTKRPPERQHQPWIDRVTAQLRAAWRLLEAEVAGNGDWLAGDGLGLADIDVAVAWTFTRHSAPSVILPGEHPGVLRFAERMEALPAFVAWPYRE